MSKAQYLLLASFIGFYGLLFTYLVMRALTGTMRARMKSLRPAVASARQHIKVRERRPWTAGLWRNA
jgi:hypothetical protein